MLEPDFGVRERGSSMRLLLVEDEKHLAGPLAELLREKNYEVDCAYDGEEGLEYALNGSYDALILDIMLPRRSGTEILAEVRKNGLSTPVLMLTALGEEQDIIEGLDAGADDYLPKPFSAEVLMARLRSITRRQGEIRHSGTALPFGDIELTVEELSLRRGDKTVLLTKKEALVMEYLMRNAGLVCEKQSILTKAWGYDAEALDNSVEVYISFLRKKLAHLGSACQIQTLRGVGYRLADGN